MPAQAPDTLPEWIYHPSNLESQSPLMWGTFVRNIVVVLFRPTATQRERQAAVDLICGEVIGGSRVAEEEGTYYVRIPDDGTAGPLLEAVDRLRALPQVISARTEHLISDHEIFEPPPPQTLEEMLRGYAFTPYDRAPEPRDRDAFLSTLRSHLPPRARALTAGAAPVIVAALIDERGRVQRVEIHQSSGATALDQAVKKAVRTAEFSPAQYQGKAVPVWYRFVVGWEFLQRAQ